MRLKRIPGSEFRTKIIIKKPKVKKSDTGFVQKSKSADDGENIFGDGVIILCKWDDKPYNRSYKLSGTIDGAEASRDYVYALINYTDKVGYDCKVWRIGEKIPYDIINISNPGECNRYTELQMKRAVNVSG